MDKRRFERAPFREPVVVEVEDQSTQLGTAADLSLGGMFVEAIDAPLAVPFGARVSVHVRIGSEILALPGIVRWLRATGIGVQFGLLGARETYLVTEAIARAVPSRTREKVATLDDEIEVELELDEDDSRVG